MRISEVESESDLLNYFSAVWYQGVNDEREEFGVNLAQDIAVGAIVSLMVFPANLIIVFLFKKSKSKVRKPRIDKLTSFLQC